jgi:hypothetical protein
MQQTLKMGVMPRQRVKVRLLRKKSLKQQLQQLLVLQAALVTKYVYCSVCFAKNITHLNRLY